MKNFSETYYKSMSSGGSSGLVAVGNAGLSFTGSKSTWVNGKLVLRSNALTLQRWRSTYAELSYTRGGYVNPFDPSKGVTTTSWNTSGANFQTDLTTFDPACLADATSQWYSNVAAIKVNLLTLYAERQKTVDMVATRLRQLAEMAQSLRRGLWRKALDTGLNGHSSKRRRRRQTFEDAWLENAYGWKPLLADIYNACHYHPPIMRQVKATAFSGPVVNTTTNAATPPFQYVAKREARHRCSIRADVYVTNSEVAAASSMGLTNPALLAWEVLPYSFVLDWVLPIGSYLEQMTALHGLSVSNPSTTRAIENLHKVIYTPGPTVSYPSYIGVHGGVATRTYYYKVRSTSVPSVPLPSFRNPVSISHLTSALALLTQQFKSRK